MEKSFITRRIDELGRIVIPKEIRNNLAIRVGEPLEILIENKSIVIRKYSQVENIVDLSSNICDVVSDISHIDLLIADREKVIVTSKNLSNLKDQELPSDLKKMIDERGQLISDTKVNYFGIEAYFVILPIITSTDCSGLVIALSDRFDERNKIMAKITQKLIITNLEVA